jgi:hypothetical protein
LKVRGLRAIEQQRVFEFRCVTDHATISDDDIASQVGVMAQFAVPPDNRRAFDHHAILNHRPFPDEDVFVNPCHPATTIVQSWLKLRSDVIRQPPESFPGKLTPGKQLRVLGLGQGQTSQTA